jgi:hypothetical protein
MSKRSTRQWTGLGLTAALLVSASALSACGGQGDNHDSQPAQADASKVERRTEHAARQITADVAAVAVGVKQGVKEGVKEGQKEADARRQYADRAHDPNAPDAPNRRPSND